MKNKDILKRLSKKIKKSKDNILIFNKRYILEEEIAQGGLSIVYKAKDKYNEYFNKESNIVLKTPNNLLLEKKDVLAFFYSEYIFLRSLEHKNIVKVLDFGIAKKQNIPYIVLEHINGNLLENETISLMDKSYKIKMFKILHSTIKYIHCKNIIHADINPSNIMVKNDKFTIFDFGISQNIKNKESFSLEYNNTKAFNPKYTAPEVLEGDKPSIQSDIFSFACVMYEIFTKRDLINSDNIKEIKKGLENIDFSNIPFLLKPWFKKALSINPQHRVMDSFILRFLK